MWDLTRYAPWPYDVLSTVTDTALRTSSPMYIHINNNLIIKRMPNYDICSILNPKPRFREWSISEWNAFSKGCLVVKFGVNLGVRTCELFLCLVAIVRVRVYHVHFFVFFVLRHWWVSQVLTPRQSRNLLLCCRCRYGLFSRIDIK